jgi:hypothetical protein
MKLRHAAVASAALFVSSASMAATVTLLNEGFNNVGSLFSSGWVQINNSPTPVQGWFQGNTGVFSAASGPANSYIAANYLSGTPSISLWLLTPTLVFGSSTNLSVDVRSAGANFLDTIEVYYSNSGASTNLADFSLLATYSTTVDEGWVTGNGGTPSVGSGRFAFRYVVNNVETQGNYIGIDNVVVTTVPEPGAFGLAGLALFAAFASSRRRKA